MPGDATPQRRMTQTERVDESSKRLLRAAMELIVEQGFANTTAVQIGLRAGYSRSMVAMRYGSKEGLLEALFEAEIPTHLLPADHEGRTGLERLTHMADLLLRWSEDRPEATKAFMVLSFETAAAIPGMRGWYAEWMRRYEAAVVENLELGIRDGSVAPGVDVPAAAKTFTSCGLGLAFRWTLAFDSFPFEAEVLAWRAEIRRSLAPAP